MSFQRAYVNCMRCYGLAETFVDQRLHQEKGSVNKTLAFNRLHSDTLYSARNEAMKALEKCGDSGSFVNEATESLDACVACDFSKPAIKDFIDKIWKEEKPK